MIDSAIDSKNIRHNCLLTRYPLFFLGKNWGTIPQLLRLHGYEVLESTTLPLQFNKAHLFINEDLCPMIFEKLKRNNDISSSHRITEPMNNELWVNTVILLAEKDFLKQD